MPGKIHSLKKNKYINTNVSILQACLTDANIKDWIKSCLTVLQAGDHIGRVSMHSWHVCRQSFFSELFSSARRSTPKPNCPCQFGTRVGEALTVCNTRFVRSRRHAEQDVWLWCCRSSSLWLAGMDVRPPFAAHDHVTHSLQLIWNSNTNQETMQGKDSKVQFTGAYRTVEGCTVLHSMTSIVSGVPH